MNLNAEYKKLRLALELNRHDVVEICRLGGVDVSASQADGWARRSDSAKFVVMTREQYYGFLDGLVIWNKR